jgi:hypothetical protein
MTSERRKKDSADEAKAKTFATGYFKLVKPHFLGQHQFAIGF